MASWCLLSPSFPFTEMLHKHHSLDKAISHHTLVHLQSWTRHQEPWWQVGLYSIFSRLLIDIFTPSNTFNVLCGLDGLSSIAVSQLQCPLFDSELSGVLYAVSMAIWGSSKFSSFLQPPKNMPKSGLATWLPRGVSVRVWICVDLPPHWLGGCCLEIYRWQLHFGVTKSPNLQWNIIFMSTN